jgi:hypothetical protein
MGTVIPLPTARVVYRREVPDVRLMRPIEALRQELLCLAPRTAWSAADWALHTATLHVRLATVGHALRNCEDQCVPTSRDQDVPSVERNRDWSELRQCIAVAGAELEGLLLPSASQQARARSLVRFDGARHQLISMIDRLG